MDRQRDDRGGPRSCARAASVEEAQRSPTVARRARPAATTATTTSSRTRCSGSCSTTCGASRSRPDLDRGVARRVARRVRAGEPRLRRRCRRRARRQPGAAVFFHDYHLYLAPAHRARGAPGRTARALRPHPVAAADYWHVLPEPMRGAVHDGLLANDVVAFHTERWRRNFDGAAAPSVAARARGTRRTVTHHAHLRSTRRSSTSSRTSPSRARRRSADRGAPAREARSCASTAPIRRRTSCAASARSSSCSTRTRRCTAASRCSRCSIRRGRTIPEYARVPRGDPARVARGERPLPADGWPPIDLQVADNFPQSVAAYKQFDVLLVNAIYDGMNLVAKEAPLVNERDGVLVLSENAGAHEELGAVGADRQPVRRRGARRRRCTRRSRCRRRSAARRREAIREHVREHDVARVDRRSSLARPRPRVAKLPDGRRRRRRAARRSTRRRSRSSAPCRDGARATSGARSREARAAQERWARRACATGARCSPARAARPRTGRRDRGRRSSPRRRSRASRRSRPSSSRRSTRSTWLARHAPKAARARARPLRAARISSTSARWLVYEPLGVVGVDRAVELPVRDSRSRRSRSAVAAGNAVVLKPSELTPLSRRAGRASSSRRRARRPASSGSRRATAASARRSSSAPGVAKVLFTGSAEVGPARRGRGRRASRAGDARARRQGPDARLRGRRSRPRGRRRALGRRS